MEFEHGIVQSMEEDLIFNADAVTDAETLVEVLVTRPCALAGSLVPPSLNPGWPAAGRESLCYCRPGAQLAHVAGLNSGS